MVRLNLFQFYAFGKALRLLSTLGVESGPTREFMSFLDAENALTDLRKMVEDPDAAEEADGAAKLVISSVVKQSLDALIAEVGRLDPGVVGGMASVDPLLTESVRDCVSRFETVFESSLSSRTDIYSVADKGVYNTAILIERADSAIPRKLRPLMSDLARYDLKQSGRCLAFEAPTASGFHSLRAVEAVIKQYYEKMAGKPWPHTHRDWGRYIKELKDLNAPSRIIHALEQTKDNYRNPLMHSEDTLDTDDAIGLFSLACSLLTMMLQEIEKQNQSSIPR